MEKVNRYSIKLKRMSTVNSQQQQIKDKYQQEKERQTTNLSLVRKMPSTHQPPQSKLTNAMYIVEVKYFVEALSEYFETVRSIPESKS